MKYFVKRKIEYAESIISFDCSEENPRKVNEFLRTLKSEFIYSSWQIKVKIVS